MAIVSPTETSAERRTVHPGIPAVLSFLVPGLGQVFNGEIAKGVAVLGAQVVNLVLTGILIGFVTGPAVWIWSIVDARGGVDRMVTRTG